MGLDQFAYHRKVGTEGKPEEFSYWRKHNRLQGWMENLWRQKTGNTEGEFNCQEVILSLEDLDELEKVIKDRNLLDHGAFIVIEQIIYLD